MTNLPYPDAATFATQLIDSATGYQALLLKQLTHTPDDALWLHAVGVALLANSPDALEIATEVARSLQKAMQMSDVSEDTSIEGEHRRNALRWSLFTQARAMQEEDEDAALALAQQAANFPPLSDAPSNYGEALSVLAQLIDTLGGDEYALVNAIHKLADTGTNVLATIAPLLADQPLLSHILNQRSLQLQDQVINLPVHRVSNSFYRFRYVEDDEREALINRALALPEQELVWRTEMARTYLREDRDWRIHEGDLYLPDGITLMDVNLIVTGDLICDVYRDDDCCTVLVMGDLRCQQLYSVYGLFVWGDMIVGGTVYQYYNDWAFEVLGTLSARAFISRDKSCNFDGHKAVLDYYYHSYSYGSSEWPNALFWSGCSPEASSHANMATLQQAYVNHRDPYPAIDQMARLQQYGEHRTMQRAIAEGLLQETDVAGKLADPAWAWEVASLLPAYQWTPTLIQQAANHPDLRIRARTAARLMAEDIEQFTLLANDLAPAVRVEIAVNTVCPATLWPALAKDDNSDVRAAFTYGRYASQSALPDALQTLLSHDPEAAVRRALAVQTGLLDTVSRQLADDPDQVVRGRIAATQTLSPKQVDRLLSDRNPVIRAQLAVDAIAGQGVFRGKPDQQRTVVQRLLFDVDKTVQAAAVTFNTRLLPPTFIEAHAARLATISAPEVRTLLATWSRDASQQRQLLADANESVRLALADNPHATPDVLIELARRINMQGEFGSMGDGVNTLAQHPRLPVEAIRILYERMPDTWTQLFSEQANTPVDLLVELLCHDHPYTRGTSEYDQYEYCRTAGNTNDEASIETLFRHMLNSPLLALNAAALSNRHCPRDALQHAVNAYLASDRSQSDYLIGHVAANPSLPLSAMQALVTLLKEETIYDIYTALARNPAVPAVLWRRLLKVDDDEVRHVAQRALWAWHGVWMAD
ncbi:hypothetical protein [Chitinivorax sp. B]|uniref:hypothetical protein n=1 Tax=Chitinivorax sp. B TaxID=2502235 RepID=UPI0010F6E824|nr:hypothetical protein [Chitinivorax sp. B]